MSAIQREGSLAGFSDRTDAFTARPTPLSDWVQSSHSGKNRRIIAILSAEGLLDTGVIMTEISRNARGASDF